MLQGAAVAPGPLVLASARARDCGVSSAGEVVFHASAPSRYQQRKRRHELWITATVEYPRDRGFSRHSSIDHLTSELPQCGRDQSGDRRSSVTHHEASFSSDVGQTGCTQALGERARPAKVSAAASHHPDHRFMDLAEQEVVVL
jgi:hypothetical protein